MANAIYPLFKQWLWDGGAPLALPLRVTLIDTAAYAYSTAHQFYSDVAPAARIGVATVGAPARSGGTLDGNDVTFISIAGPTCEAVILWCDTSVEATSHLMAYLDTISGLPITPSGGNILLTWDVAGILTL
jgi:hypothetical protein